MLCFAWPRYILVRATWYRWMERIPGGETHENDGLETGLWGGRGRDISVGKRTSATPRWYNMGKKECPCCRQGLRSYGRRIGLYD